jgi:hypothetical protein
MEVRYCNIILCVKYEFDSRTLAFGDSEEMIINGVMRWVFMQIFTWVGATKITAKGFRI